MLIFIGFAAILLLTVATGYFVAQEFAYVAVDRGSLRAAADRGDRAAARALEVTNRLSFMLSGAQLGITVTALLAGYVAEPYLGQGLAALLGGVGVPTAVSLSASLVVALLLATVIQMVLGELAPKNLAIARPEVLAKALAPSTLGYLMVAGPLIRLFDATSNRLLRAVGITPIEELPQGATHDDLDRIIATSSAEGLIDPETSRLLARGLDLHTLRAAEVMVPRVDVVTVRPTDPATRVVRLLDTGHTRFPVIDGDEIVGLVAIADVIDVAPADRPHTSVDRLAAPALLVPDSLPLPALLERLRDEHRQLACVIDEFGGFAGVVSLEDIAEELVGEIRDEDDLPEPTARTAPDGSWLVPGRWRLDEVAEATGVDLPDDEVYETLSGLVMYRLGRIPQVGDTIDVPLPRRLGEDGEPAPSGTARLRVEEVRRHVPATVHIAVAVPVARSAPDAVAAALPAPDEVTASAAWGVDGDDSGVRA